MATTEFNKEYLDYTKQEAKKWHLYMGGSPGIVETTTQNSFDWGKDVNFLYRIRESDINFTTNRNDWQRRSSIYPWKQNSDVNETNLVFNPENNIAYLCVSDNLTNRSDLSIRGKNLSIFAPSHTVGVQNYDDGYSWYALFSVDPSNINLLSANSIPVPDINDYSNEPKSSTLEYRYSVKCGASYKNTDGVCCLYPKEKFVDGVGVTQEKGYLFPIKSVSKCYQCYDLANKLGYEFNFISGVTLIDLYPTCSPCDCTYPIVSTIEQIEKDKNDLNPSGSLYFLYNSYNNWISNRKGIFSIFIDLESLTETERTISVDSPVVSFSTISGTGASARIITQPITNGYLVTGIELISRGSGYNVGDAVPVITGAETSVLNSKIQVNICPEDFPEIPHVMLNNMKTSIRVNIDNDFIKNGANSNITQFTKFGLLKNVKDIDGEILTSDSLNNDEFQILRATTTLTLGTSGSNNLLDQNPNLLITEGTTVKFNDSESKKGQVAYFKYYYNTSKEVTGADIEIISKDYNNIIIGDYIQVDSNFKYVVTAINKPDVSFATGQALLSKNTSIKFPNVENFSYQPKKSVTFTITKS